MFPAPTLLQPIANDDSWGNIEPDISARFTWVEPIVLDQELAQFMEDPRTNIMACARHDQTECFVVKCDGPRLFDMAVRRIESLRPNVRYIVYNIVETSTRGSNMSKEARYEVNLKATTSF